MEIEHNIRNGVDFISVSYYKYLNLMDFDGFYSLGGSFSVTKKNNRIGVWKIKYK